MKKYLIVYCEVRHGEALATFHTIEESVSGYEALKKFKEDNEHFNYKVIAMRELKSKEKIYL